MSKTNHFRIAADVAIITALLLAAGCSGTLNSTSRGGGGTGGSGGGGGNAPTSTCDFSKRGSGSSNTQTCTISYNDPTDGAVSRDLRIHIPSSFASGSGLVFFIHGGGGSMFEGEGATHLTPKSDSVGFVVVYPQGTVNNTPEHKRSWNVLLLQNDPTVWAGPAPDDVNYVRQIVALVKANLPIDPNQVFVTGLSVGGLMAHRLGIELSDVVAAVAPVASPIHEESNSPHQITEALKGPVSVLIFQGDADQTFPYCGLVSTNPPAYLAGQDEGFDYWATTWQGGSPLGNNCATVDHSAAMCINGSINANVSEKDATNCSAPGVEVKHYKLMGGNHQWYEQINTGACDSTAPCNPALPNNTGLTPQIWDFFSTHHKAP